jgi:malonyl-CoA O-methyltransferase
LTPPAAMPGFAATLEAYERWAPSYPPTAHNPLMRVEQSAMLELWPQTRGLRVLDLACGTGRYARLLEERGAAEVVALDASTAMLRQVAGATRVCGGMMHLPFVGDCFGAVVCGLAVGHADDVDDWMLEVARVLQPGGALLYSDFHPQAHRAGLVRSFKDGQGRTCTVPHRSFEVAAQRHAAAAAGLTITAVRELRVGIELNEVFPGSDEFYTRWHGLPLVLVIRARR